MNTNERLAVTLGWKRKRMPKADGRRYRVWVAPDGTVPSWSQGLPDWSGSMDRIAAEIEGFGLGWALEPARAGGQKAVVFLDNSGHPFNEVRVATAGYYRIPEAFCSALILFLEGNYD